MHILLEEAPLLVYYFLTLFLSNYKLRLILSIFWTTSTFCQLELPCSLRSLRSLLALAYARAFALTSFRAESSLRSLYNKRSLRSHLLYSLVPSISIAPCEFAFRFAQYNSRSRGSPSDTFLNVHSLCQIRLSNRYVHTAGRRRPFWFT